MTLVVFITVAFLTAKILSFMNGRKSLAILKSMGLKNKEVAAVIAVEALLAPLLGIVVGIVSGSLLLKALEQSGTGLSFVPAVAFGAVASIAPAAALGILVPSRFSQIATVLELLFERAVPLFHERSATVDNRLPGLDAYMAKGTKFIKLNIVEGDFEGVIFRQLGDEVKPGEVIAQGTSWWGLKVKSYVAPLAGIIVYFQQETGYIGIGPKSLLD